MRLRSRWEVCLGIASLPLIVAYVTQHHRARELSPRDEPKLKIAHAWECVKSYESRREPRPNADITTLQHFELFGALIGLIKMDFRTWLKLNETIEVTWTWEKYVWRMARSVTLFYIRFASVYWPCSVWVCESAVASSDNAFSTTLL